jgi:hypothetical protein
MIELWHNFLGSDALILAFAFTLATSIYFCYLAFLNEDD